MKSISANIKNIFFLDYNYWCKYCVYCFFSYKKPIPEYYIVH